MLKFMETLFVKLLSRTPGQNIVIFDWLFTQTYAGETNEYFKKRPLHCDGQLSQDKADISFS